MNWTEEQVAARTMPGSEHADYCNSTKPIHEDGPCNCGLGEERTNPIRTHSLTAHQKATGRIRQPRGMNKTEARYAQHLEAQKAIGAIAWYKYEGITLKLAPDCRLTFDFAVMAANGALELHDCKASWNRRSAHIEDDALAKMKNAAENFPFRVLVVWPGRAGEWESREF